MLLLIKLRRQQDLAIQLFNLENGRNKPNVEALQKLAEYFGVSVDYFLEA